MLVERGDENGQRHAVGTDRPDNFEPIAPGHLYVEQHDLRSAGGDRFHGSVAVAGFEDVRSWRDDAQQFREPLARERFIVDDQDAPDHALKRSVFARTTIPSMVLEYEPCLRRDESSRGRTRAPPVRVVQDA